MGRQQTRSDRQLAIILLIGSFFFTACSSLTARISERQKDTKAVFEARELISALKDQNLDLNTFKGVGKITLWKASKKSMSNRIAWVGSAPNKLRIVLSTVSGQPVASLASDGQWFYIFNHTQTEFYKRRATHSLMEKVFEIPIRSTDIINILAGRIPISEHKSAVIIEDKHFRGVPSNSWPRQSIKIHSDQARGLNGGYILILKTGWGNIKEKIYLYSNKKDVHKIEVFGLGGDLSYRAEFDNMLNVDGYKIPSSIVFSNDDGSGFQLDVDRYWPHVYVSSSMFVLSPPE